MPWGRVYLKRILGRPPAADEYLADLTLRKTEAGAHRASGAVHCSPRRRSALYSFVCYGRGSLLGLRDLTGSSQTREMLKRGVDRVASQNELATWWGCSCWRRSTTKHHTHWHQFLCRDPDSEVLGSVSEYAWLPRKSGSCRWMSYNNLRCLLINMTLFSSTDGYNNGYKQYTNELWLCKRKSRAC
jgi:hypothetical protein